MADSLGNDIFLILVLSYSTCLVFIHVYLFFFLFCHLHLSFGKHMQIMHALLHSLESIGRIFFSLHFCSWEQVKLSSSFVYPWTFISSFRFSFHLFYCIPFCLSCRIGEDFNILAFITFISKTKPINSFSQTLI